MYPTTKPRPDLQALGINYRKISILAIGTDAIGTDAIETDIYIDTSFVIPKLESLYPENLLGSKKPFEQGLGPAPLARTVGDPSHAMSLKKKTYIQQIVTLKRAKIRI